MFPRCRRRTFPSRRWRPSSSRSCRPATGSTSRSGTASAACSRTSAAGCGSGRATGGRCCATSRSSRRSARSCRRTRRSTARSSSRARGGSSSTSCSCGSIPRRAGSSGSRPRSRRTTSPSTCSSGKGKPIHELPLKKRRRELEQKAKKFRLSPATDDPKQAARWLDRLEQAGLDGVIAKRLGAAVPARLARRRGQGEAVQDGRLRDRRLPLERQGRRPDLDAAARPLRRRRLARLRRALLRVPGAGAARARGRAAEDARAGEAQRQADPRRPEPLVARQGAGLEPGAAGARRARCASTSSRATASGTARSSSASGRTRTRSTCTWDQVRPKRKRNDPTVEKLLAR